jgi:hypothetical protein
VVGRTAVIGGFGGHPHLQPGAQDGLLRGQRIERALLQGPNPLRDVDHPVLAHPDSAQAERRTPERSRIPLPLGQPRGVLEQWTSRGQAPAGENGLGLLDREGRAVAQPRRGVDLDRPPEQGRRRLEAVHLLQAGGGLPGGRHRERGVRRRPAGRRQGVMRAAPDLVRPAAREQPRGALVAVQAIGDRQRGLGLTPDQVVREPEPAGDRLGQEAQLDTTRQRLGDPVR